MRFTATDTVNAVLDAYILASVIQSMRNVFCQLAMSVVVGIGFFSNLQAADWRVDRGFALDLNTAEEVGESRQGNGQTSVLRLSPFVELSGVGRRTELALRASLDFRSRLDIDSNESNPSLKFESNTRLIERVLSVATAASLSDRIVDNDAVVDDSVLGFGTTSRIREFSATPVLTIPFGSEAALESSLRLSTTKGTVDNQPIGSTTTDLVSEYSQSTVQGLIFSARVGYLIAEFDSGEKSETSSVTGNASVPLSRTLSFNAGAGYETLRFDSVDAEEDGESWRLGLSWNPIERITVDASYGRRFFGTNPILSIQLEGRRTVLQVSLSRNLAFERGSVGTFSTTDQDVTDPGTGQGAVDAIFEPEVNVGTLSPISRDAKAIDERASISYKIFGKRSVLAGVLSQYERSRLDTVEKVESRSVELSFTRQLTKKTSFSIGISERRSDSQIEGVIESGKLRRGGILFVHVL